MRTSKMQQYSFNEKTITGAHNLNFLCMRMKKVIRYSYNVCKCTKFCTKDMIRFLVNRFYHSIALFSTLYLICILPCYKILAANKNAVLIYPQYQLKTNIFPSTMWFFSSQNRRLYILYLLLNLM